MPPAFNLSQDQTLQFNTCTRLHSLLTSTKPSASTSRPSLPRPASFRFQLRHEPNDRDSHQTRFLQHEYFTLCLSSPRASSHQPARVTPSPPATFYPRPPSP